MSSFQIPGLNKNEMPLPDGGSTNNLSQFIVSHYEKAPHLGRFAIPLSDLLTKLNTESSNTLHEGRNAVIDAQRTSGDAAGEKVRAEYDAKLAPLNEKINAESKNVQNSYLTASQAATDLINKGLENAANPDGDFKSVQDAFHDVKNRIGDRGSDDDNDKAASSWDKDFNDKAIPALQDFANKVDPDNTQRPFNLTIGVNVKGKDDIKHILYMNNGKDVHPEFYKEITLSLERDDQGNITNGVDVAEQVRSGVNKYALKDASGTLENVEMTLATPDESKSILSNRNDHIKSLVGVMPIAAETTTMPSLQSIINPPPVPWGPRGG